MNTRWLLLAVLSGVALVCCWGCAATSTVNAIGVSRYRLDVRETRVDGEGRAVVKADLVPYTVPIIWPGSRGKSGPPRAARYVVGDPATVRASVREAWDRQGPQGLEVRVAEPGQPGWQMVPFDTRQRSAKPDMLAPEYRELLNAPAAGPPHYRAGVLSLPSPIQRHVAWWHWPAQILLVPALVFDLFTLPIQLEEFGRRVR